MQSRLLLSIIALATVSLIANAKAGDDHVKIGVLTDMNGPYAAITGKGSVAAAELAIEDFGGKTLGNSVELVSADHMQKPDIGAGIARKWYDNEGVDAIFDGAGSSVALATLEIARARNKIVAFSGVISPDVTGKLCGETISSWAWDTHAMVATSIKSLMKSGEKRFFFLTLDAAAGRALEVDATRIIEANGGAVIGSVKHPINTADFSSFLLQAQSARPDVIVLANAGADTVTSLKQAAEFGLTTGPDGIKSGRVWLAMINDIEALGLEFAHGVFVSESSLLGHERRNAGSAKRFKNRTGAAPNMLQAAVYSSVLHYLKAVARIGKTEGVSVAAAMKDIPINDMYSKDVHLRADGRAVRDFYLFEVKSRSELKGPWDDYKLLQTVPGDEAFPASPSACALLR